MITGGKSVSVEASIRGFHSTLFGIEDNDVCFFVIAILFKPEGVVVNAYDMFTHRHRRMHSSMCWLRSTIAIEKLDTRDRGERAVIDIEQCDKI